MFRASLAHHPGVQMYKQNRWAILSSPKYGTVVALENP